MAAGDRVVDGRFGRGFSAFGRARAAGGFSAFGVGFNGRFQAVRRWRGKAMGFGYVRIGAIGGFSMAFLTGGAR